MLYIVLFVQKCNVDKHNRTGVRVKLLILLVNIFILSACAAINKSGYYYNEIVIHNKSSQKLTDVRIKVKKTQAVFSCNVILSGRTCSNKFPKRKYLGNSIQVSWTYLGRNNKSEQFILNLPKGLNEHVPLRGVLDVTQNGKVVAYLEQGKN